MKNFNLYTPTNIIFGKGEENNVGQIISNYGYKKILLHYGKNSIKTTGLYDKVVNSLKASKIDFIELSGVEANPKLSLVHEGVKLCKEHNIELVLAVGGGSVIDSAKSISNGAKVDFSPWEFSIKNKTPKDALPVGVILTLSAAGSEMSQSCVITNDETWEKRGFNSITNRALFSIMNPELTYSVDKFQTGCGIVDILMHTLERYYTVEKNVELTDYLSEGLFKSVIEAGRIAIKNPNDYDARATLMWASSLSHNDLMGVGRDVVMPVHQIEHEVSGMFDYVAHGAGLSVLFPAWAKVCYVGDVQKFARFAYNVMDVDKRLEAEKAALKGIELLEDYFKEIGMPTTFKELNITSDSFEKLAKNYTFNGTRILKDIVDVDYNKCLEILYKAE